MRKWVYSALVLIIVIGVIIVLRFSQPAPGPSLPEPVSYQEIISKDTSVLSLPAVTTSTKSLSPSVEKRVINPAPIEQPNLPTATIAFEPINLNVPFQSQAPFGIWELPYKEACEEASTIMVDYYVKGKTLTADTMDTEIRKFVQWQTEQGYHIDVSIIELQQIVEEYYGYQTLIIENPTVQSIMAHVNSGRPVLLPLLGQEIGNPFYTQPGPPYHMLIIKGMTHDGRFITNDPGTKRGENYVYDTDVLLDAVSDWSESEDGFPHGPKRALVIY